MRMLAQVLYQIAGATMGDKDQHKAFRKTLKQLSA